MTLTIRQATALNRALYWVLNGPTIETSDDEARELLAELAAAVNSKLLTGVRPDDVRAAWGKVAHREGAETIPCVYCHRAVAPRDAAAPAWFWPGRGRVTVCGDCAGDDGEHAD
jgi:hypothetical protein